MRAIVKFRIFAVVAVVLVCAAGAWVLHSRHANKPVWRMGAVRKGDLTATITATGTVEPEEVVDVGAQVSGLFLEFGKDKNGKLIDYGSVVKEGMLLAKIDPQLFQADVDLDTAVVASDKAGEAQAAANVEQMKAKEVQAEADWKRAQVLGPSEALAPTTFDSYKANYDISKANVSLAEAAVASAKAATVQAQATLKKAQQTLDYCTIKSPVDGVIIDRRVNIGETVASSLNTPSLFLIAKDLTRIQVWVSVNEADIGKIHTNQDVMFTVDAFPDQKFHGKVNKVRLNATMTQNVVTYTVEVNTDNFDGKLLPYLTANVHFLTGEAHDAYLVPNSALRWHPASDLIATETKKADEAGGGAADSGQRRGKHGGGEDGSAVQQAGTLWVPEGGRVRPVRVNLGLSDGTWTEVQGEGVSEGMTLVLGVQAPDVVADTSAGANPFIPQFGRRGGQGGQGGGRQGGAGGQGAPGAPGSPGVPGGGGGQRRGNNP
jgi:HlyD family secretion protein